MKHQRKQLKSFYIFLLTLAIMLEVLLIILLLFGKIEIYLFLTLGLSNILIMVVSLLNIKKLIKS